MNIDRGLLLVLCTSAPGVLLLIASQCFLFFYQRPYIIKRYEEETDLAETERMFTAGNPLMVFKNMKVAFYTLHLFLIVLMNDQMMKKNPNFKNSPSRKEILSHFSSMECIIALVTLGCGILGMVLLIVYLILNYLWK